MVTLALSVDQKKSDMDANATLCSNCVHCKVRFEEVIKPAYFSTKGMRPTSRTKLVKITCAENHLKDLPLFATIEEFEESDANTFADECHYIFGDFELDD